MKRLALVGRDTNEAVIGIGFDQMFAELCKVRRVNEQMLEVMGRLEDIVHVALAKGDDLMKKADEMNSKGNELRDEAQRLKREWERGRA